MTVTSRLFSLTWWSVWTSALFSTALGLVYLLSSPSRFSGPAFVEAQKIATLHAWGTIYLACGISIIVGILAANLLARWALYIAGTTYIFFAILFYLSAQASPLVSYGSVLLYAYVTIHCFSAASILPYFKTPRGTP